MFVDVQGYTSRTARQTREETGLFVKEMGEFIEKHVKSKEGNLVKTMGDGFLVTFESPTNAITCGMEMLKDIEKRNANIWNEDNFVRFRIGVSTGEVTIEENGDVYGDAVNIAARIQNFAVPNEIFISESTYLAMNKSEVQALDLGPQRFKNLLQEVRVFRVLKDIGGAPTTTKKLSAKSKMVLGIVVASLTIIIILALILRGVKKDKKSIAEITPLGTSLEEAPGSSLRERKEPVNEEELNEAIRRGEEQLKKFPNNVKILRMVGHAHIKLGHLAEAEGCFRKLIEIEPDTAPYYRVLAMICEREERYGEAIEMLKMFSEKAKNKSSREEAERKIEELERKIRGRISR